MNKITFSRQALKDLEKIKAVPALKKKAALLLNLLAENPLKTPPPFEKLSRDLEGFFSRRINVQHRLVYQVLIGEVKVLRMWTHYE